MHPQQPSDTALEPNAGAHEIALLPTSPAKLEQILKSEAATKDPPLVAAMLVRISDLLHSPAASPELRSALYQVLGRLDGVSYAGQMTDPAGRQGEAIAAPTGYANPNTMRKLLIFDPKTSRVLALETQLL
jgi:hypothetical protein